jgi:tRNA splicing endonuclease
MANPAQISATTTTEDVTTASEITQAVIEYIGDGSIVLTTIATQQVSISGQTYQGTTTRHRAIAPSLAEAAARAEAMFANEDDADDFTSEEVMVLFAKLGRYFSRFHTVQDQVAQQVEEQEDV